MHKASDIPELKVWSDPSQLQISNVKKVIRLAWRRAFGDVCQLCKRHMHFDIKFRTHRHFATIDHIMARSLGGANSLENIQVICRECNNKKSRDEYHQSPLYNS